MVQSPLATKVPEPGCEISHVTASCAVLVRAKGSALTTARLRSVPVSNSRVASRPDFPSMPGFSAQPEGRVTLIPRAALWTLVPPLGGDPTQSLGASAAGFGVTAGVTSAPGVEFVLVAGWVGPHAAAIVRSPRAANVSRRYGPRVTRATLRARSQVPGRLRQNLSLSATCCRPYSSHPTWGLAATH
jgi:hypothetical protein